MQQIIIFEHSFMLFTLKHDPMAWNLKFNCIRLKQIMEYKSHLVYDYSKRPKSGFAIFGSVQKPDKFSFQTSTITICFTVKRQNPDAFLVSLYADTSISWSILYKI